MPHIKVMIIKKINVATHADINLQVRRSVQKSTLITMVKTTYKQK